MTDGPISSKPRRRGTVQLSLGDGSCGKFVRYLFDSDSTTQVSSELDVTIEWRSKRRAPYDAGGEDLWVTARDGYSYVGMVPDDGQHSTRAVDFRTGHDVRTDEPRLNVGEPVPAKMIALFSDAEGNAVFADGYVTPGAFRGTKWERDASDSLMGKTTEGLYRIRETPEEERLRKQREHVSMLVTQAWRRTRRANPWLVPLNVLTIVGCFVSFVAFMSRQDYGMDGVMANVLFPLCLSPLLLHVIAWAWLSSRELARVCAEERFDEETRDKLREKVRRRRRAQGVACALLVATLGLTLWYASDLAATPENVQATYLGPSASELDQAIEHADSDDDETTPSVEFEVDDTARRVSIVAYPSARAALGASVSHGDKFRLSLYPHTGCIESMDNLSRP